MLRVLREWVLAHSAPASPLARACALHLLCRDAGVLHDAGMMVLARLGVRSALRPVGVSTRTPCELVSLHSAPTMCAFYACLVCAFRMWRLCYIMAFHTSCSLAEHLSIFLDPDKSFSPLPTSLNSSHQQIVYPTHRQHELHITGSTGSYSHGDTYFQIDLLIQGARTRSYAHQLCTSKGRPEIEQRSCDRLSQGEFHAITWLFVPGIMLESPPTNLEFPLVGDGPKQMFAAMKHLRNLGICSSNGHSYSKSFKESVCRAKKSFESESVFSALKSNGILGQCVGSDFNAVGAAFVIAAESLPQPFAIVEHGNMCGLMTVYLAVLRRRFCPRCTLYSSDPGLYRSAFRQELSCTRDALQWAGIEPSEVVLTDDAGAAVNLHQDIPVGFMYLDDGKLRVYNSPTVALIHDRLMVGGVLAFDDTWDTRSRDSERSIGHLGHGVLVHELLDGGDFSELRVSHLASSVNLQGVTSASLHSFMEAHKSASGYHKKTSVIRKLRSRLAQVDTQMQGRQLHALVTMHSRGSPQSHHASLLLPGV